MRSPLEGDRGWLVLDEVGSTQDVAASLLSEDYRYGVVFAHHQKSGRGRFSRGWISGPGDSIAMSLTFRAYADHPAPHFLGMSLALAAARAIGCRVQWPNDLTIDGKKVGGILTELRPTGQGALIPIVGIGVNLNQASFPPEIADRAVSLFQATGRRWEAEATARLIVQGLSSIPEPVGWESISNLWHSLDETAGKRYRLTDGRLGEALAIGESGELICLVEGNLISVMAADAIFGP